MASMASIRLPGLKRAKPEDVKMDSSVFMNHTAANQRYIKMGYMPGVAECVVCDNRLVYTDFQGFQDRELGEPMTDRSLHRCFSLTKPITAFGLMVLHDEGKVRLDDPVSKYIPSFKHMYVLKDKSATQPGPRGGGVEPARRQITLRQLITHTSGLGYGPGRMDREDRLEALNSVTEQMYMDLVEDLDEGNLSNLEEFCDRLAKLPLRFHPGEKYKYSMGVDVIGRVLEVVSGLPLDVFLRTRVFEPLGMRDTTFAVTPGRARRRLTAIYHAKVVSRDRTTNLPDMFSNRRRDGHVPEASAWVKGQSIHVLSGGGIMGSYAGGLLSSLRDQALFCSVIVNGGFSRATGLQVLKPCTVRLMCKDWLKLKSVTRKRKLDGWYDKNSACKTMGWCALGMCDNGVVFMGGVGSWSIHLKSKTICVTMSNSWSESDDVHGWAEEVDELEGAVKTARAQFVASSSATKGRDSNTGKPAASVSADESDDVSVEERSPKRAKKA